MAQWFAVYTTYRHEKRVSELLAERNVETFLPLYKVARSWKKSAPGVIELPLFACYLFVNINPSERSTVLGTPGVVSIVGSASEPWPLSTAEIEVLRRGTQLAALQPHPYLARGERVSIMTGPMAGAEGILARHNNEMWCVLTLEALMRSVAVEISGADLELIDREDQGEKRVGVSTDWTTAPVKTRSEEGSVHD